MWPSPMRKNWFDRGDYPNVSAAVSGELARARASRERDQALVEAEVARRLALPQGWWEPIGSLDDLTATAFSRLDELDPEERADPDRR
jgi:antitoxin ParD1/3/4